MKNLLILFLCCQLHIGLSQSNYLSVLGKSTITIKSESQGIRFMIQTKSYSGEKIKGRKN